MQTNLVYSELQRFNRVMRNAYHTFVSAEISITENGYVLTCVYTPDYTEKTYYEHIHDLVMDMVDRMVAMQ